MEFPPETYDVFDSDLFETARARLTGDAVMEVMLQMRPNGRCLDHYRIALDGTVLETQVNAIIKVWWHNATLFCLFVCFYNIQYRHSFNHIYTIHLSVAIRRGLSPSPHRFVSSVGEPPCGAEPTRYQLSRALPCRSTLRVSSDYRFWPSTGSHTRRGLATSRSGGTWRLPPGWTAIPPVPPPCVSSTFLPLVCVF